MVLSNDLLKLTFLRTFHQITGFKRKLLYVIFIFSNSETMAKQISFSGGTFIILIAYICSKLEMSPFNNVFQQQSHICRTLQYLQCWKIIAGIEAFPAIFGKRYCAIYTKAFLLWECFVQTLRHRYHFLRNL